MRILAVVAAWLAITLPALAWTGTLTPEMIKSTEETFRFNGKPIHPGLIRQFEGWLSDPGTPIVVTVDVAAAADTNQYSDADVSVDKNGIVSITENYRSYGYQYVGRLANGLEVVHTWSSGRQGSAVMQNLFLLRFTEGTGWTADGKPYPRLLLNCERAYPLGDRTGVTATLDKDKIRLKIRAFPSGKTSEKVLDTKGE
jgi:hypothetical protein